MKNTQNGFCKKARPVIAFVLFAAAAAFGQQPRWVTTKEDIRFPDESYMIGVGAAPVSGNKSEAMRKSGDEAFSDIAKQLRANISDVSASRTIEVSSGNGASDISSEVKADLRVSTDLTLGGLKVVDSYYDRDNHIMYSLAILDRSLVGSEMKDKLNAYHEDYERFYSGISGGSRGVVDDIASISGAYRAASEYNSLLSIYNYIVAPLASGGSGWSLPGSIATAYLDGKAQSLLGGISLRKVSGEEQEVKLNEVLKPLVVKAVYTDSGGAVHPLQGLQVRFTFINGNGKISPTATTGDDGEAECQVYALSPYASTFYTIAARLDLSRIGVTGEKKSDGWERLLESHPIAATFSLVKTKLTLDDKLRQLTASLVGSLSGTSQKVCVSRIDYQGKIPGELSEYLRQHIESALRQNTDLQLVAPPVLIQTRGVSDAAGPLAEGVSPELTAASRVGIGLVFTGSYWQRSDGTELDLNAVDSRSGAIVASSDVTIPGNILPGASLVPANYQPAKDDPIISNRNSGDSIKVNLWVNHPDGVYHDGDTMSIYLSANKDVYAELVYVDASGQSLIIFPNTYEWNNRLRAGKVYAIPNPETDGILKVEPPFGREIIKVYASETPFPIPNGRKVNGLVLLNSVEDFQSETRGIGLVSKGYQESSIVISTFQSQK